jgi:DinB superfamily
MERCEGCGFAWDEVAVGEIPGRLEAGTGRIGTLLAHAGDAARERPTPGRWSALEYAGHVRDVLLMLRDRLVVGLIADDPSFTPMYRDERVDRGLYDRDAIETMRDELDVACALFARFLVALPPVDLTRPVQYGFPAPTRRSLLWMAQQAVHEVEHHGDDIAENLSGHTG